MSGWEEGKAPAEITEAPPRGQSARPDGNCSAVSAVGAEEGAQPHGEEPQTPSFPKVQPEPRTPSQLPVPWHAPPPRPPGASEGKGRIF